MAAFRCAQVVGGSALGLALAAGPRLGICEPAWPQSVTFPPNEFPRKLFDGETLAGWEGHIGRWFNAKGGAIVGTSTGGNPGAHPQASTYLTTQTHHRNFRLLLEARISGESRIHTGVAILGRSYEYKGEAHSYQGQLVMIQGADTDSKDWGLFELYRRDWHKGSVSGAWCPGGRADEALARGAAGLACERGGWHRVEVLVREGRVQTALNGVCIHDYHEERPELMQAGPIGLQLHWIASPWNDATQDQRVEFRSLWLVDEPTHDQLITLEPRPTKHELHGSGGGDGGGRPRARPRLVEVIDSHQ